MVDYREINVKIMVVEFDVRERDGRRIVNRTIRAVPPSNDPTEVGVFIKRKLAELIARGFEVVRARIDVIEIPILVSEGVAGVVSEEEGTAQE